MNQNTCCRAFLRVEMLWVVARISILWGSLLQIRLVVLIAMVCSLGQQPCFATPANFIDSLDSIVKMSKKDLLAKYGDRLMADESRVNGIETWTYRLDESFRDLAVRPKVQISTSEFDNMVCDVSFFWGLPEHRVPASDKSGRLKIGFDRLNNTVANSLSDGIHSLEKERGGSRFVYLVKGDNDTQRWLLVKSFIRSMNNLNKLQVRSILGDTVNSFENELEYQITPVGVSADGKHGEDDILNMKFLLETLYCVSLRHEHSAVHYGKDRREL